LLSLASHRLRALGRLAEAQEPMRAGLDRLVGQENWRNAAIAAGNLSELELTLGEVETAIRDAGAAVAHADRSGGWVQRSISRTTLAEAQHQLGQQSEPRRLFAEAEAIQATHQPDDPLLYSMRGFQYCDMMLADAERAAWRLAAGGSQPRESQTLKYACRDVAKRATQTIQIAAQNNWLLDIGLDHLTLACAALYQAILSGRKPDGDLLREAADVMRRAGSQDNLPRALLTRALFRAVTGGFDGAREDLDEAYEVAERGPMRLFLADTHLHRARLFGLMAGRPAAYPWTSPRADLDAAARLIDECGYGRRREELADAEAAYARLYGASG
jgi:hypothetical protein